MSKQWTTRKAYKFVIAWKESRPCVDCGLYFRYFQTEADHVPERGVKIFNLGERDARKRSEAELTTELAKCDNVCRNCHAFRGWCRVRGLGFRDLRAQAGGRLAPGASLTPWSKIREVVAAARLASGRFNGAFQAPSRNSRLPVPQRGPGGSGDKPQAIRRLLRG